MALNVEVLDGGKDEDVSAIVTELKGIVSGLLFKVATNTKDANDQLGAIRMRTAQASHYLGDLVAKAELDFEQMQDAEQEETADLEAPDAEKTDLAEGGSDGEVVTLLQEIRDATKETAEHTQVLADAAREESENVLDPGGTPTVPTTPTSTGKPDTKTDKATGGIMGALAMLLGGVLGTLTGLFTGWLKALKFVFYRGFIARIGNVFAGFFKGLKTQFKAGAIGKGFAKIGQFFARIGAFLGRIFKIFGTIFGFIKNVVSIAGKVAGVVSKIFAPLLIIFGIFETIKGFFEGFANTEGNLLEKIMGGLAGALTGFLDFLIAAPLNLLKGIISWIAGALGFEGVKEKLDSFDFSFGGIVDAVFGVLKYVAGIAFKIMKFPIALAAGIGGGIAALVPGGKSPKEGFMDAFNAVMNFGQGQEKPKIPEGDAPTDGDKLTTGADGATADAEKDMETKDGGGSVGDQSLSNNVYPFKLSGFDQFDDNSIKHDEYTITGKNKKGQFLVTDPNGRRLRVTNPKAAAFIRSALKDKQGELREMQLQDMGGGEMLVDSVTGDNLMSREQELAEKRAGYYDSGQGRFDVTTNVGGTNSSVTNSVVVTKEEPGFFTRIKNRWNGELPS